MKTRFAHITITALFVLSAFLAAVQVAVAAREPHYRTAGPTVEATPIVNRIYACLGMPSPVYATGWFYVQGHDLSGRVSIAAPAGFEVSQLRETGFGPAVQLGITGSTLLKTQIFVRAATAMAPGPISGNITISSVGASELQLTVNAVIEEPATANPINDQTVNNGEFSNAINITGTATAYAWDNDNPAIGLPASGYGNIPSFRAVNNGNTPVVAHITVRPLNKEMLYVPSTSSGAVHVINRATGSVVENIQIGGNLVNLAVSPDGNKVYVCNSNAGSVAVINTATNTIIETLPSSFPSGIAVSPDNSLLYVASDGTRTLDIFDTDTYNKVGSVAITSSCNNIIISADGRFAYLAHRQANVISVVSTATNSVVRTISTSSPMGMALDEDHNLLYVSNNKTDMVSVFDATTFAVVAQIATPINPAGMAISLTTGKVYVTCQSANAVAVINTADQTLSGSINVSRSPLGIFVSADGYTMYTVSQDDYKVSVVDVASSSVVQNIPIHNGPIPQGNIGTRGSVCEGEPITFTITVNPDAGPVLSSTSLASGLGTTYGTASAAVVAYISGENISSVINAIAPNGFEISYDNITFTERAGLNAQGKFDRTPLYIRLKSTAPAGQYTGDIILTSQGAADLHISIPLSGVNPAGLNVTVPGQTKTYGEALSSKVITGITATGLKNGETLTSALMVFSGGAEAGSNAGIYDSSVGFTDLAGNGFDAGNYDIHYANGDLRVNRAPLMISANDSERSEGEANPLFTAGYSGFVNGDNVSSLIAPPIISTTATENSPAGQYPITVSGALSGNYNISYTAGILLVKPKNNNMVDIPSLFTPNGDGVNDTWLIKNIAAYPNCILRVFTRAGNSIFYANGYTVAWAGNYKGQPLPAGVYYYTLDLKNGARPFSGSVTILR